jgi:predicted  nucleic acid-binding Zn-ribbon protein
MEVSDLEDEIEGLNTRLEKLNKDLSDIKTQIEDRKNFIKESQTLIKRYEEQQNNVKNNREFLALSKEVDLQKLEIMAAEKKIKEFQNQQVEKKTQVEAAKLQLDERKVDLVHKKEELKNIAGETQKEEDQLLEVREKSAAIVDARLLNAYARIRKSVKNRLAVVTIERNACAGCFSKIPPQRQLDIKQHKKVTICENCGRILIDSNMSDDTRDELEQEYGLANLV